MKNTNYIIIGILSLASLTGCSDYLNQVPKGRLSDQTMFETRTSTKEFLASVYTYIPDEFNQRQVAETSTYRTAGPWTAGCDEAEYVWGFVTSQLFNNNTFNASDNLTAKLWKGWYDGIHNATTFMIQAPTCKELTTSEINQWTAEARAIRAIYYFYLVRTYGPVPIIGEAIIPQDSQLDQIQFKRNTVDECLDYIVSELNKAKVEGLIEQVSLLSSPSSDGYGRIDQTIAQGFIAEALMLKASPLYAGSNPYYATLANKDGKLLFPNALSNADKTARWKDAADASAKFIADYVPKYYDLERVLTADGKIDPYASCRSALRGAYSQLSNYKEMIFYRISNSASTMQYDRTPYHNGAPNGDYRGAGGLGATQVMVDAYFMANGQSPITGYAADGFTPVINTASGYTESGFTSSNYIDPTVPIRVLAPLRSSKMYYQREPRFYANITFNGQKWLYNQSGDVFTQLNFTGNSGKAVGVNDYCPTGYVVRKCAPEGPWTTQDRVNILLRLAQVYLNYAEALNEYNPGDPNILKYINLIRERAGIPQYGTGVNPLPVPVDQNAMRAAIRTERTVELMFENTRYFDVRRWNIAQETQNKAIYGMNIGADGSAFYARTKIEDRVFDNRLYFFPIPQGEISIDSELVQNPGF